MLCRNLAGLLRLENGVAELSKGSVKPRKDSGIFGGWLVIYLAIPFAGLVVYVGYHGIGSAPGIISATYISAATATITTLTLVVFGVPLASHLAHTNTVFTRVAKVIIRLPLGIPPLVSGIMLLIAFGPYSTIGRFFGGRLVSSMAAIVLAQLFVEMPFVVEGSRAAFSVLSPEVFEVSFLLGIPNWRRIAGIELPLAIKSVRTAVMMGWLRAFGEFGATVLVAYHPTSLPVMIFAQFSGSGLTTAILPVAAVLIVSFLAVAVIGKIFVPSKLVLGIRNPSGRGGEIQPLEAPPAKSSSDHIEFGVKGHVGGFAMDVDVATDGRSLAITGPSGAGKSMTLRSIAGLAPSLVGRLDLGGVESPRVAYVPQGQGLFDHLNVYAQMAASVRWAGGIKEVAEIERRIFVVANQVGIVSLLDRRISTLSGGQRQRVALARSIAANPDLLILDEPFSALDRFERDRQIRFVRNLVMELNLYLIVVTHDITEAAYLSESLAIIDDGLVIANGSVGDLMKNPGSVEVAQIMGYENILGVTENTRGLSEAVSDLTALNGAGLAVAFKSFGHRVIESKILSARGESSFQFEFKDAGVTLHAHCVVSDCINLGTHRVAIFSAGNSRIELDVTESFGDLAAGDFIEMHVELDHRSTSVLRASRTTI